MQQLRRSILPVALSALLLPTAALAAGEAPAEPPAARVTAVTGTAHGGDQTAFEARAPLSEDGNVVTEDESNCSVLVDEDALVELCGGTSLQLTRRPDTGQRVVRVDAGHVRLVVEPREVGERIEIHTPAAIATILGSVVFVEVDPRDGRTTISSAESDISIRRPSDPDDAKGTIVGPQEQLTLDKGGPLPTAPAHLTREALSNLGGCLVDFHAVAVNADRAASEEKAAERIAIADAEAVDVEAVGAAENAESLEPVDDPYAPPEVLEPTDTIDVEKLLMEDNELPGCGGGLPQEGCDF